MRYNENNSERLGDLCVVTNIQDDDSVFEVSLVVVADIQGTIRANYDLTVQGDIDADSLIVMGDFICFGNCKVNTLSVQGSCKIFGQLEVADGMVSDNLTATDIDASSLNVNGNIVCNSANFEERLVCDGKIIALDGMMGSGSLKCSMTICGEYASLDDSSSVLIAAELEESLQQIRESSVADQQDDSAFELKNVEELDWDECKHYLQELSKLHPEFEEEYMAYVKLYSWSDYSKICDLKQFLYLMKDIFCVGDLVQSSDLYKVVKTDLFDKAKTYVCDLVMPSLTQEEFALFLNTLIHCRDCIDSEIYEYLTEMLFNKIGLKYSTVRLMLEG